MLFKIQISKFSIIKLDLKFLFILGENWRIGRREHLKQWWEVKEYLRERKKVEKRCSILSTAVQKNRIFSNVFRKRKKSF